MKASLLFVRRRAADETPDDNEAIFMAAPTNIGYDATGRSSFRIEVITENGEERQVRKHQDLFSFEVTEALKGTRWEEAGSRALLPSEGVLGAWAQFKRNPQSFFV